MRLALRRIDHPLGKVAHDDAALAADDACGRKPSDSGAGREVENRLATLRCEPLEHEVRHGTGDFFEVRVAVVPARSHRLPHRPTPPPELGRVH